MERGWKPRLPRRHEEPARAAPPRCRGRAQRKRPFLPRPRPHRPLRRAGRDGLSSRRGPSINKCEVGWPGLELSETPASFRSPDVNADDLARIAQIKPSVEKRGRLASAAEHIGAGKLFEPLGIGADDDQRSIDGCDVELSVGGDQITLAESLFLPDPFPG